MEHRDRRLVVAIGLGREAHAPDGERLRVHAPVSTREESVRPSNGDLGSSGLWPTTPPGEDTSRRWPRSSWNRIGSG
jgi:hypothetical protein